MSDDSPVCRDRRRSRGRVHDHRAEAGRLTLARGCPERLAELAVLSECRLLRRRHRDGGNILTTTRPTGPAAAWSSVHIDDIVSNTFVNQLAVSCAGPTLCVAFDLAGRVFSSTDPAASEPTWTSPHAVDTDPVDPAVQTVSCPSTDLCVALGSNSTEFTSTDPASPNATWSSASLFTYQGSSSVTCPTTAFCIAAARDGDASTTTIRRAGVRPGTPLARSAAATTRSRASLARPSTLCVAVSSRDVDTSTAPAQNTWTIGVIDPSAPLLEVSCPDASLCVAIDADGYVFWSQNPAGGAATWVRSAHSIDTTRPDHRPLVSEPTAVRGRRHPRQRADLHRPGWRRLAARRGRCRLPGKHGHAHRGELRRQLLRRRRCSGIPVHDLRARPAAERPGVTGVLVGDNISSISCLAGPLCVATGPYEIASTINPTGAAERLERPLQLKPGRRSASHWRFPAPPRGCAPASGPTTRAPATRSSRPSPGGRDRSRPTV